MHMTDIPTRNFTVHLGDAAVRIPGFRPGRDRCRVRVADMDRTLCLEERGDGVALVLSGEGGETSVHFPGLTALPMNDITVSVGDGTSTQDIALTGLTSPIAKPRKPRRITEFVLRPGQPIPSFRAFAPGQHVIEVDMGARTQQDARIEVRPSPDGADGILFLDGREAAILAGAPFATARDIRLVSRASDQAQTR